MRESRKHGVGVGTVDLVRTELRVFAVGDCLQPVGVKNKINNNFENAGWGVKKAKKAREARETRGTRRRGT